MTRAEWNIQYQAHINSPEYKAEQARRSDEVACTQTLISLLTIIGGVVLIVWALNATWAIPVVIVNR